MKRLPWMSAAILTFATLFAAGALADERSVSVTVYNSDLAVVRDAREIEIPKGLAIVPFPDVPIHIDPTSVHLKADRVEVLEQNYRYDLVSPEKILDRYLDSQIRVILDEGRLYEGVLLSYRQGQLVLGGVSEDEGLVILSQDKITDMQFPELPEGLITRPTLEWRLDSARAGRRAVEVSYMTSGMAWHAEYIAVITTSHDRMDLSGWVSVENRSGATYADADLQLVAGDVHRAPAPRPSFGKSTERMMAMNADGAGFVEETLFEYHLYTLGRKTTLRDNETKQVSLFSPTTCDVKKIFEANPRRDGQKVRVMLETTNSAAAGLGMPLPKGKIRVYQRDSGDRLQFVGEDLIDHTPRDEDLRVFVGNAFDLVVERTEVKTRRITDRTRETDVKIEVRNRKEKEDVIVVVQESFWGDWAIVASDHEYVEKDSRRVEFHVPVRAGQVLTVTYTVRSTH